jgi:nitrate/nitrite-specific signal transduction histidine kinase
MRCCIDALSVIRDLNSRSNGLKKYDVYEKAITRQRRELEKVNRKFSELYGDYSEHLINESEYLSLKNQYLTKSEALKKEIDNLLISQNLYSKHYKINEDWESVVNKYMKCRKLNQELVDAFVDKVLVYEDGRIAVNLIYDDCLNELLQVKTVREGDLYE